MPDEREAWRMGCGAEEGELIVHMPYGVRFSRLHLLFSSSVLFANNIHFTVLRSSRFSDHLILHLHPDFTEGNTLLSSHGVSYRLPSFFLRQRTAYFREILPAPDSRSISGLHTRKIDGPGRERRAVVINVSAEVLTLVLLLLTGRNPFSASPPSPAAVHSYPPQSQPSKRLPTFSSTGMLQVHSMLYDKAYDRILHITIWLRGREWE
jgi:hypothetical protein